VEARPAVRSLRNVLSIMERFAEAKAGFRSLTEATDTTTPAGRMMMQMVGVFAEFERAMLRERTKAGLDAAGGEGRVGGRRPKLSSQQQTEIRKMVSSRCRDASIGCAVSAAKPTARDGADGKKPRQPWSNGNVRGDEPDRR
jgi:DNA invertase Pin-like site-specific DNA recombinase